MNRQDFLTARDFIYSDIQREINSATTSQDFIGKLRLKSLIKTSGGGNFLAALGLLSYTEFAGRLRFNKIDRDGKSIASENFNYFFDSLGGDYKNFRTKHNVYDIFRCGLSHEYFIKKNFTICMLSDQDCCGVGLDTRGRYYFVVERYFSDFQKAFDLLENELSFDS